MYDMHSSDIVCMQSGCFSTTLQVNYKIWENLGRKPMLKKLQNKLLMLEYKVTHLCDND